MDKINIKQTNEYFYTYTLDNGLKVYFYNNPNVKNFYMTLGTKFGSADVEFKFKGEDTYRKVPYGLAHFLEHITFHLDGMEAEELFTPYGAYINAYTSYKRTCYLVSGNSNFDKCLDNLLYFVYTSYYTEETVENEKGIIKEESKMCDDNVDRVFVLNRTRALFSESNYTHKIVGNLDDIDSISLQNINDAYDVFYHPSNMYLIIAGNFDNDEAIKVIDERMKTFTFKDKKDFEVKIPLEPINVNKDYYEYPANSLTSKVSYSIKIPISSIKETNLSQQEYEMYLTLAMLSIFGSTSKCYQELLEKDIVNYPTSVRVEKTDDYEVINITSSPKDNRCDEFIDIIKKYINNIELDENEIKRKIKAYKSSYLLSFDDNEEVVYSFIDDIINYGTVLDNFMELIDAFTIDKAKKIINSIDFNNKSIVIMRIKEDN